MTIVSFPQHGLRIDVEPGVTLLDAARRAGVDLESPCNGSGTCGKCRVHVQEENAQGGSRSRNRASGWRARPN